jgi:hypothetical protein
MSYAVWAKCFAGCTVGANAFPTDVHRGQSLRLIGATIGLTAVPILLLLLFCEQGQRNAGGFHDEGIGWTELFMGITWAAIFSVSLIEIYRGLLRRGWSRTLAPPCFTLLVVVWPMTAFLLIEQFVCVPLAGAGLADAFRSNVPSMVFVAGLVAIALFLLDPILRRAPATGGLRSLMIAGAAILIYAGFWLLSMSYLFRGSNTPT